jgi:hypothetical protein
MVTRAWRVPGLAAAASIVVAGCEMAGTAAPEIEPRIVVHAVLNPTSAVQTIIVEKTLRSVAPTPGGAPPYEPIGNARVVIHGPRQDSVIATRATGTGVTNGVYRVSSITVTDGSAGNAGPNVLRIRPGERYELRVETTLGVASGETIVPVGGPVDGARRTFNLDRDTLRLSTANVRNAAGYYLRHETTTSLHERYVTTLEDALVLPLSAEPEWSFSFAHEAVFPGLAQRFSVVAVDSNYFRYYVAGFDPFGDDTRGNTLTGGVGLFGAVAPLMSKTMDLTANIDTPIEGAWAAVGTPATLPTTMTLYSSPYFPGERLGQRVSLTGTGQVGGVTVEAYGYTEVVGATLQFFPVGQTGQATAATGSMTGNDLVLTETRTGERVTYRKR